MRLDAAYMMVLGHLNEITQDHGVHIPYAVESGSRTWGFASDNSDYDVRGIFVRPRHDYLRLNTPRDTIEVMTNASLVIKPYVDEKVQIDCSLWDAFKAMRLLSKLNPQIIEWLQADHDAIYRSESDSRRLEILMFIEQNCLHSPALFHHYRSMAWNNFTQYVRNPSARGDEVLLKKYLYVLRPLSVLLYINEHNIYPPLDFEKTLDVLTIDGSMLDLIRGILSVKRGGVEHETHAPYDALNKWIDDIFKDRLTEARCVRPVEQRKMERLHALCEDMLAFLLGLAD